MFLLPSHHPKLVLFPNIILSQIFSIIFEAIFKIALKLNFSKKCYLLPVLNGLLKYCDKISNKKLFKEKKIEEDTNIVN